MKVNIIGTEVDWLLVSENFFARDFSKARVIQKWRLVPSFDRIFYLLYSPSLNL